VILSFARKSLATVQCAELIDSKWRIALESQVGHRLAQVAIVMDDLVDGISKLQQLLAMRGGRHAHLGEHRRHTAGCPGNPLAGRAFAGLIRLQRLGELVQEHRNAVPELARRGRPPRPARHLLLAATDQLVAIVREKGVHHDGSSPSTPANRELEVSSPSEEYCDGNDLDFAARGKFEAPICHTNRMNKRGRAAPGSFSPAREAPERRVTHASTRLAGATPSHGYRMTPSAP
jgi:hypothetical protein